MGINEVLREKRGEILRLAAKHGARNVRVFGAVARGEADEQSDVVTERTLRPRIRARVGRDAVAL